VPTLHIDHPIPDPALWPVARGRMVAATAGASLLLVLGGCGGHDSKATQASEATPVTQPTPDSPSGAAPQSPSTPQAGTPELVTPRSGMANLHPVHWESADLLSPRTVRITFYGGVEPCDVLDSVKVTYHPDDVTFRLFSGSDPAKPDTVCIAIAKLKAVDVQLTEDVGGRELKDGTSA
jgi:hypothetical protein